MKRLVVLVSGEGTNLQAIIDACADGVLPAEVVAVVSDRGDCNALRRGAAAGIPAVHVSTSPATTETRAEYDSRLADVISGFAPDWIVLAGWMRLLTMSFLGWFPGMVVNLHPALPGELPGRDAIRRAYDEHRDGVRAVTGVMVHMIPDEGIDNGPTLASEVVAIDPDDTLDSLTERVRHVEHRLYVDTLIKLCRTGAQV